MIGAPTLRNVALAATVLLAASGCREPAVVAATATPAPAQDLAALVAHGDYLVRVAGCNDCHTAGYPEAQGRIERSEWLKGSPMGYTGPWGTTYASNLRLVLADMDEAQWLDYSATLRTRPIMPDFALRAMTEHDRRAIYHFIRSLGPGGGPAPEYLPPGQRPPPPYMELVLPQAPEAGAPAS